MNKTLLDFCVSPNSDFRSLNATRHHTRNGFQKSFSEYRKRFFQKFSLFEKQTFTKLKGVTSLQFLTPQNIHAALLQSWDATDDAFLTKRHGWPMTAQAGKLLQAACRCQWNTRDDDLDLLRAVLRTEAVAYHEIAEVRDGMLQYYDNERICDNIRDIFRVLLEEACTEAAAMTRNADADEQLKQHAHVPIYSVNTVPRLRLRHRYVLHLFSGVKRQNDLHSQLLEVSRAEGIALFPISLDIVLSKTHGDLYWTDGHHGRISLCGVGYTSHLEVLVARRGASANGATMTRKSVHDP